MNNIQYKSMRCSQMTKEQIVQTAELFSNHYGVWSDKATTPCIPGNNIKLSSSRIKQMFIDKPDRYVSLAYDDDKLIGHAFYMKRCTRRGYKVTWILQLVVSKDYRGNKIGTKLMHSIWGMSDNWAWGLYTANPYTIKALEDSTMRKVQIKQIEKNLDELKTVAYDLFDDTYWIDSYNRGIVNTGFPVDHSDGIKKIDRIFPDNQFGLPKDLPESCEWFAFVFSNQHINVTKEQIDAMLGFSEDITRNAYRYMQIDTHDWASHEKDEMDFIIRETNSPQNMLDLGCGTGRHCRVAAQLGINSVGVDYNIDDRKIEQDISNMELINGDVRKIRLHRKFDVIISLYDVIGTSPEEKDNQRVLLNAYRHLKHNGKLIISVMNMNITRKRCHKYHNVVINIRTAIQKLVRMKSSNTMQENGNVFNGYYILIDESTGICYRKEQFYFENDLPIEYIVTDRRYSENGICRLVNSAGFRVEKCYCVKAGHFNKALKNDDSDAKEILVVAHKANIFFQLWHRHEYRKCWKNGYIKIKRSDCLKEWVYRNIYRRK